MRDKLRRTRVRLTLVYAAIFALVAVVAAAGFWAADAYFEFVAMDATLQAQAGVLLSGLEQSNGTVTFQGRDTLPPETTGGIAVAAVVATPQGRVLDQTAAGPTTAGLVTLARQGSSGARFATISRRPLRVLVTRSQVGGTPVVLVVARPVEELLESLVRLAGLLAGGLCTLLVGAAILSYRLSGRALGPVRTMSGTARELSEHDLHRRIELDLPPGDEIGELAATFNGLLSRLDAAFDGLQRFTADAAHELRAPLALMRTELEVTLRRRRSPAEYEASGRVLLQEVRQLARLADQLLLLARADAGELVAERQRLDLGELVEETVERWRPLARERQVGLDIGTQPEVEVEADPALLRRVIDNLVDNAIRHTPAHGAVTVSASRSDAHSEIAVQDTGPGVDAELRPRLFERFTRADSARGRGTGGAGLGLSLCAAIVRAHGGSIGLEEPAGGGARFVVRLRVQSGG